MMKAMDINSNGEPAQIEVTIPKPTADELLVKIKYSAIDTAVDAVLHAWTGYFLHAKTKPLVLGWHFSGVVEAVGENVTSGSSDYKIGDEVFGHLPYDPANKQGSFSEYITVSPHEVAHKPSSIGHDIAAASTTESLTALQALRDHGGLGCDSSKTSVLIVGAGGGVGSIAIGIAKLLDEGAKVTTICSSKDVDQARKIGADIVLDRAKVDFMKMDDTYDIIFDTPCAYSAVSCMHKLNKDGVYVTTLPSWSLVVGMFMGVFGSKSAKMVTVDSKEHDLELMSSWILNNGLKIETDSIYNVSDLGIALKHHHKRSNKAGRVILKVDGGWN